MVNMKTMAAKARSSFLHSLLATPFTGAQRKHQVVTMYRNTLKELAIYPSMKRSVLRNETRRLYRLNKGITDAKDLEEAMTMGKNGLQVLTDQNDALVRTDVVTDGFSYTFKGPF